MNQIRSWRLYVITDRVLSRGRSHAEVVRAAIEGGADAIQFRDKYAPASALYAEAEEIRRLCREAGKPFIVNDRVDLALAVDADGVHVGQDDLPARVARRLIGPNRILGVSAATVEEAAQAASDGADYLGVGPVFEAQSTKPDARPPIGLSSLAAICAATSLPVIAIGGIHAGNSRQVIEAGAAGVAVISTIVGAEDIAKACRALRTALGA